ncbi:MAG: aminopeptidase, partial [Pseudobdellovibrio sp.]
GKMPYKGFFTEAEALEEAKKMQAEGYDTFVRGVTAYSTLGYFSDSVLSSMLRYSDYDLVNTIIHETVHSTIYIKNNADFNERLAVFIGNKGTEMFYHKLEGAESPTVKKIENENHDDFIFSQFITDEIKKLTAWYSEQIEKNESLREEKFMQIQLDFKNKILPKMNNKNLNHSFLKTKMNNAYLGLYKTYMQDLSDFEKLYSKCNSDIILFMQEIKKLEKSDNPEEDLKKLIL